MQRNFKDPELLLDAAVATAVSKPILTMDYRNQELTLVGVGATVTATVKVMGSDDPSVDFSVASSPTNSWSYLNIVDMDTRAATNGSTGAVLSAAGTKQYEINCNTKRWMALELTWTAGAITAKIAQSDNK